MIKEKEAKKSGLLLNFKVYYLENMLKSSTKSVAKDVVSTLIDTSKEEGVLLKLSNYIETLPEYEEEADEEEKRMTSRNSETENFNKYSKTSENPKSAKTISRRRSSRDLNKHQEGSVRRIKGDTRIS